MRTISKQDLRKKYAAVINRQRQNLYAKATANQLARFSYQKNQAVLGILNGLINNNRFLIETAVNKFCIDAFGFFGARPDLSGLLASILAYNGSLTDLKRPDEYASFTVDRIVFVYEDAAKPDVVYKWLPSSSMNPRHEHQVLYGSEWHSHELSPAPYFELPGDLPNCQCGLGVYTVSGEKLA